VTRAARPPARVALIGFMGCGKTTVGRLLAARLGYAFLDLDQWLERRGGRSVRQIFQESGEEAFRDLESSALRELSSRRRVVIAAGGGAPVRDANRPFFRQAATFYLEISFEEFLRRTAGLPGGRGKGLERRAHPRPGRRRDPGEAAGPWRAQVKRRRSSPRSTRFS
jgi:shikimate kinase